jgi:hypothetical protein
LTDFIPGGCLGSLASRDNVGGRSFFTRDPISDSVGEFLYDEAAYLPSDPTCLE